MPREIEGYSIEVLGEPNGLNTVCDCFSTWEKVLLRVNRVVEEKADQYDAKPICLLRVSSQQTCNTIGVVNMYSLTKAEYIITIQIRAIFKETSSLQDLPGGLSSSAN
jgi:hypothetical protein